MVLAAARGTTLTGCVTVEWCAAECGSGRGTGAPIRDPLAGKISLTKTDRVAAVAGSIHHERSKLDLEQLDEAGGARRDGDVGADVDPDLTPGSPRVDR